MTNRAGLPSLSLRPSAEGDLAAIQRIYAYHVLHGLASFEAEPPSPQEMARRRRTVLAGGFPHLVAERGGEIVGYAYASPYRTRPAYCYTAENSIYIRHDCARQGIGAALLDALIAQCEAGGLRPLVAVIGDSGNTASIELHHRAGFMPIATIRSAGYKFGRWVDTVLMQRSLGLGDTAPPP
jgi:L-amino acid N-acyltransferase YncA